MSYGNFFEGLSQGYGQRFQRDQANLQNKRQQDQTDLNERRVRNTELDSVQREARRVAEQDRADEQQTMTMLMQPGLTEESRKAIRDARVARRNDNTAYIRSLSADPTNAADITKRFGDITKLITPSTIESGVMPSPTVDMLKATEYADKYRKEIGLLPENKRSGEVSYRQKLLSGLGLNPNQIQQLLPDFGKVMSTTPGKMSEFQKVDTPFNLPEELMFGGKQYNPDMNRTIETRYKPDGSINDKRTLEKRYIAPDVEEKMTYEPDVISAAKAAKHNFEVPRIQAQIAKLNAETKAIPQKVQLGVDRFLADVKDKKAKVEIQKMLVGVRQTGNSIRLWGLQQADKRGQEMLGLRSRGLDIAETRNRVVGAAKLQANVNAMRTQLNVYKAKQGRVVDEQRTAEGDAIQGVIEFLEDEITKSEAAIVGYGTDDGLDEMLNNAGITYTPPYGYPGFAQPGYPQGGGYSGYPQGGGYSGYPQGGGGGGQTFNLNGKEISAQELVELYKKGNIDAGLQKKTQLVDESGKPIDSKNVGGTSGQKNTRLTVGGNGTSLKVGVNTPNRDALNRYLSQ